MIEYGFTSRNMRDSNKYKEIRDTRLELKRKKDKKQLPYKLTLNSSFGASKDIHNALNDPLMANCVCIAGQLLMLDLLEKLEPYGKLIQTNTDGAYMMVEDMETVEKIKEIAKEWEVRTGLDLEWEIFSKVYQRDVNNYIIVDSNGKYKSKGCVKKRSAIDYDLPIITKAIVEYCVNGTPVEKTIMECDDLIEFQKVVKVSSLYKHALYGDEILNEKVLRVFASTDENAKGVFKVKSENRIEKIANTPEKCFINNDMIVGVKVPDYLDKDYYINLANEQLADFLGTNDVVEKMTLIDKVDVIINNEYANFYELLKDVKLNHEVGYTQLTNFIIADKFNKYGKVLKLINYIEYFKLLYNKKSTKDVTLDKLSANDAVRDLVKKYSVYNEGKGTYSKLDSEACLMELFNLLEDIDIDTYSKLRMELKIYDDLTIVDTSIGEEELYVMNVNDTKNPTIIAYNIHHGDIAMLKVEKSKFKILSIEENDIIKVNRYVEKPMVKVLGKDEKGVNIIGEDQERTEWWIDFYDILDRDYNKTSTIIEQEREL